MTGIVHQTFFVFLELSHIGGYVVCGVLYSKSVKYIEITMKWFSIMQQINVEAIQNRHY